MNNQCPKCSTQSTVTEGRFRDLTNARFDSDYDDGVYGIAHGVKILCPKCGEINLFLRDWMDLSSGKIAPDELDNFNATYPTFQGVIPLGSWLDSIKQGKNE
ncbi:hypothetical protein CAJ22_25080 [Salmonella enterica]|nr:hypothetical protein [Salmonella enterica]